MIKISKVSTIILPNFCAQLVNAVALIEQAREYSEMPKLTAELLRVFIRRIEVFEKPEKYSRTCGNTIIILYTFECNKAFIAAELGKHA